MSSVSLTAPASKRTIFISAGLVWSLAILVINILPVMFEALQHDRNLTEAQLGTLGTAFVVGLGITTASGPLWVYKISPRLVSLAGITITAFGLFGVGYLSDNASLPYWWFVIGLAGGCLATPSYTALGYAEDTVKSYSRAFCASLVLASVTSYALPLLVEPQFGGKGVMNVLAVMYIVGVPFALRVFDVRVGTSSDCDESALAGSFGAPSTPRIAIVVPLLAALSGSVFAGTFMGMIYNFVGTLATVSGVNDSQVSLMVALSLIGSIGGSILPTMLSARFRPTLVIGFSVVVLAFCYPVMMIKSPWLFGLAFVIHMSLGTLGYMYYLGVVAQLDYSNKVYVACPAFQAAGIGAGTSLAGYLLAGHQLALVYGIAAAGLIASFVSLLVSERIGRRYGLA